MPSNDNRGHPRRRSHNPLPAPSRVPWDKIIEGYGRILAGQVDEVEGPFWRAIKGTSKITITIYGSIP